MKKPIIIFLFLMLSVFFSKLNLGTQACHPRPSPTPSITPTATPTPTPTPVPTPAQVDTATIKWRGLEWTGDIVATHIGDVVGEETNEVVAFTSQTVIIQDGNTGQIINTWNFEDLFANDEVTDGYRGGLLYDLNQDGKAEIIFQMAYQNGSRIIVLDGQTNLIWTRETGDNLVAEMRVFNWSETGALVIHTGKQLLAAQDGQILKNNLEPIALADLTGDNQSELITATAVYNQKFETISTRSLEVGVVCAAPVVKDLDNDGPKEIILLATNGLYVFNSDYSLKWSDLSLQFHPPYYYYDLIYRESIALADVDNDGTQEIFTRTFNGSYDDYDPSTYTTTCYKHYGQKLWSSTGEFEPYAGLPNPLITDLNHDGSLDLVFVDGNFILEGYNPQDGSLIIKKKLYDYYASTPPLAVGDTDNDQQQELVAGNICIDRIDRLMSLESVFTPFNETENNYLTLNSPHSLVMADGSLWAMANQSIVFYDPGSNQRGYLRVTNIHGAKAVLVKESDNTIALYSLHSNLKYGLINTTNRQYIELNQSDSGYHYYNPLQVNGNYYYYLKDDDFGNSSLYQKDLTTQEVVLLQKSLDIEKILGFPNQNSMLVARDFRLSLLDLTTFTYTDLIDRKSFDDSCPMGTQLILTNRAWTKATYYPYDNEDALTSYDPASQQAQIVLTNQGIQELIYQNTGLTFTVSGVTMQKRDEDHLYLLARTRYQNKFDPGLPFEIINWPAEHQLPFLFEYTVSTGELAYRGIFNEYGRIKSFCYQNDHFYYVHHGRLSGIYDYDLTTQSNTSLVAPETIKNQYPDSQVVQLATRADGRIYALVWAYEKAGGRLNDDLFQNHLYEINPSTGQWQEIPLDGVEGLVCGLSFVSDPNHLYLYCGPGRDDTTQIRLYEFNLTTRIAELIYLCDAYTFKPINRPLCSNGTNRLYFSLPQVDELKALNYFDLDSRTVQSLKLNTGCDALSIWGANAEKVYLALHLTNEWNRVNLYEYQLNTNQLTLVSSLYTPDNQTLPLSLGTTHFGYLDFDFGQAGFKEEDQSIFLTNTREIFSSKATIITPSPSPTPTITPSPGPTNKPKRRKRVRPILEKVYQNADGSFTAVFGYYNPNKRTVRIPIGKRNKFRFVRRNSGQPKRFLPGRQRDVFRVNFKRHKIVWKLDKKRVTAHAPKGFKPKKRRRR